MHRTKQGLATRTSVVQNHALTGRDNSLRSGIEEDPRWGALSLRVAKTVHGKKYLQVKNTCSKLWHSGKVKSPKKLKWKCRKYF